MKELGEYLKETRESNCVGLEEASEDLNVSTTILENIEKGNIRAFRDMYDLKEKVKDYAKYLGLEPDKVIDEFNDFFFEHTSKIKLEDILQAEEEQRKKEDTTIVSPYTKIKKQVIDVNKLKIIMLFIGILLFLIALVFIVLTLALPKENIINKELYNKVVEVKYEYS